MICFSDSTNFRIQNFFSLHLALNSSKEKVFYHNYYRNLKKNTKDYVDFDFVLKPFIDQLTPIASNKEAVFNLKLKYSSIRLFTVVRSELISYLLTSDRFLEKAKEIKNLNEFQLFLLIYDFNKNTIINFFAAALFWENHWNFILDSYPVKKFICFSGCKIYNRTLNEVCKVRKIPVFKTEHLFTGQHFYLVKDFDYTPNNIPIPSPYVKKFNKKNVLRFFQKIKNLNVLQPKEYISLPKDFKENGYVLILGQVVNDFSLTEQKKWTLSIRQYEDLILQLTQLNYNVVLKTHPWEKIKHSKKIGPTYRFINKFVDENKISDKVLVVEEANLYHLIDNCSFAITICSQSGLEVLYKNKTLFTTENSECFYQKIGIQVFTPNNCSKGHPVNQENFLNDFNSINNFVIKKNSILSSFEVADRLGISIRPHYFVIALIKLSWYISIKVLILILLKIISKISPSMYSSLEGDCHEK